MDFEQQVRKGKTDTALTGSKKISAKPIILYKTTNEWICNREKSRGDTGSASAEITETLKVAAI